MNMKQTKCLFIAFVMVIAAITAQAAYAGGQQEGGSTPSVPGGDALNSLLRTARSEKQIWDRGNERERNVTVYSLDLAKKDQLFQAVNNAGYYQVWSNEYTRDWELQRSVLMWCVPDNTEKGDCEIQVSAVGEKTVHTYSFKPLPAGMRYENGAFVVPAGVTVDLTTETLRLGNGATLTVNGTVNARGHGDQGKGWVDGGLSIEDGTTVINGNGTINLKSKGRLLSIGERRKLTLDGVTLVGLADNNESLVNVSEGGEFVLKSGKITGNIYNSNDWADGGGVRVWEGTFTMEGGTISGNKVIGDRGASGGGVGIGGNGATFTMSSGTITSNSCNGFGSGINVDGATFIMQGGTISANFGGANGGVWLQNKSTFIMEGGTIYGKADSLPAGTDASLANSINGNWGVALGVYNNSTARWGTGGTYTRGRISKTGGSDITDFNPNLEGTPSSRNGTTDETLIAIPAR
jgi:hypothetical protein